MRYSEYIKSEAWTEKRARILKHARGKCEKCGKRKAIQVHHKTYKRVGREKDEDLAALCGPCHQSEHPDKPFLSPSFVGTEDCPMCPSETAEVFAGSYEVITLCVGCGHVNRRPRVGAKPLRNRAHRTGAGKQYRPKRAPTCDTRPKSWVRLEEKEKREHSEKVARGLAKLAAKR
jgi:HNH endonuclease